MNFFQTSILTKQLKAQDARAIKVAFSKFTAHFHNPSIQENIRNSKIMLQDSTTGCRVKHPFNRITWEHSALKLKEYNLQQCFFGQHLLKLHPTLPVSIVESEKTAIIASVYFPQFIWLATGGKHGCK